jgi:peroxiredoxin
VAVVAAGDGPGTGGARLADAAAVTTGAATPLTTRRFALMAAVLVVSLASACQRGGRLVGQAAPEFSLADLAGNAVRLANYKGRVVFLNVWATWCPPCREEMPAMQALYERLRGPGFEMLAVSADEGGRVMVEPFVNERRLTFPVLLDPEGQVALRYGVTGFPETFVIDRNGRVVSHAIGPRDWSSPESVAAFQRLLEHGEWREF